MLEKNFVVKTYTTDRSTVDYKLFYLFIDKKKLCGKLYLVLYQLTHVPVLN